MAEIKILKFDSFGDHRIAMGIAMLSLFADDPVSIMNVDCVSTSYPDFWIDMEKVTNALP